MIKKYFYKSPTTLAIGDGLNDILMLRESDIGIEICEDMDNIKLNSGDIITNKFYLLRDLLIVYGRNS